ncbi:MAG: hypothetical protein HKN93_00560 [Acidimicrobiia bacterium]|nr:hypothetical protein [Acidimicrobiia bacterium]
MKRLMTVAVVVMMIMAIAVPAMAAGHDRSGKSNVWQCDLEPTQDEQSGRAHIMFKDNGDGTIDFVLTGHDLTPLAEYEMRSGGILDPVVKGYANKGGNLLLKGTTDPIDNGSRINLWEGQLRWWTDNGTCTIPDDPQE